MWFTDGAAKEAGGSITSSPRIDGNLPRWSLPGLSDGPDLLGDLEGKHWFIVSDLAGILSGLTVDVRVDTLIAIALIVLSAYVVWRTPFGLRLRSAGEKPGAAESLGVSVPLMRYVGLAISGAFAGLGGRRHRVRRLEPVPGGTGLRSRLPRPRLARVRQLDARTACWPVPGCSATPRALADSLDAGITVHGLILGAGIALVLLAVLALVQAPVRRRWRRARLAALAFVAYALIDEVNKQFVYMTAVRRHVGGGHDLRQPAPAPACRRGHPLLQGEQL